MPRPATPISLEHIILALLDVEPLYGYELHNRICEMPGVNKIWNVKQALFYSKLDRLELDGYIEQFSEESEEAQSRIMLRITEAGKSSLMKWIATPVPKARDLRQIFLAKLIVARRYGNEAVLELIQKQRQVSLTWYDELVDEFGNRNEDDVDEFFVTSYRLYRDRATLHWLDYLEKYCRQDEQP